MNDQQHSSADALTEAERLLLARVNDCTKPIDAADRNGILKLIDRLAASPSSQPAAAPLTMTLNPAAPPLTMAPSPADERAAFEKVFPMPAHCQRIGHGRTAGYAPTEYGAWEASDFIRRWEGWKAARACSANETGTEGLAHEVWAAAQLASGEGIEDGTQRIAAILSRAPAQAAEPVAIYQVSFADEEGWCDAPKEVFDRHPAHARRIVYGAPPPPAPASAPVGLTEQAITDAVKKWFPDRAYQAPFFARELLEGAKQ